MTNNIPIISADDDENALIDDVSMDDFFNEQIAKLNNPLLSTEIHNTQPTACINSTRGRLLPEHVEQLQKKTDREQKLDQQFVELQNKQAKLEEKQKQITNDEITQVKIREQIQKSLLENNSQQSSEQLRELKHQQAIAIQKQQQLSYQTAKLEQDRTQIKIEQLKIQEQSRNLREYTNDKKQQLEELSQKCEQLQAILNQKEQLLIKLQAEKDELNKNQIDGFELIDSDEKDRQLNELLKKLEQEKEELIRLEDEKNDLKKQIDFEQILFDRQIEKSEEQLKQHNKQLNELLEQLKHEQIKMEQKEKQIAQLQSDVKKKKDYIEFQQKQIEEQLQQQSKGFQEKIDEKNQQLQQQKSKIEQEEQYLNHLQAQNKQLKDRNEQQQKIIQQQLERSKQQTDENQRQLEFLQKELKHLHDIQQKIEEKEQHLIQLLKIIKTIDYHYLPFDLVNQYLIYRIHTIEKRLENIKRLPSMSEDEKKYFKHKIPNLIIEISQNDYQMTLTGFQNHHDEFSLFLQQILTLYNVVQKAIDFYGRYLNEILKRIRLVISKVKAIPSQYWKQYSDIFIDLLQNKIKEYSKLFNEFLTEILKSIYIDKCINDFNQEFKPWIELRRETEDYMKKNPFNNEIEKIKQQTLDEFIKQQVKIEKKPADKSKNVLRQFIKDIKTTLENDHQYNGQELKHFQLLPELLRRIIIYYKCYLIQLPLYESAKELLNKIQHNTVTTISTATGSGW